MVYRILFYLVNIFLRIYYRKIHVIGTNNIPKNKPIIIVSNHPNGFIEPIMMACVFPVDLHFLVRGDLFENKALRPLLLSTNQIPIYRFRDGFASLRNNQKTILKTIEVLKGNNAILMFPEGSTNGDWKLRPLQKGAARMAFQCIDQNPELDIQIVPVGITFSKAYVTGTEAILKVGKPFSVNEYYIKNTTIAKEKMDQLTNRCYDEMKNLLLHLEQKDNEETLANYWQDLNIPKLTSFFPRVTKDKNEIFEALKLKADSLNKIEKPVSKLTNKNLSIILSQRADRSYLIFAPLAFIGYILWLFPIIIGNFIIKKYVKQREFIASIGLASKGALSIIFLIMVIAIGFIFFGILDSLLFLIAMFLSGIFYIYYSEKRRMVLYKSQAEDIR